MSFLWRKRLFMLLLPLFMAVTVWQIRVENDLNAFFTATDSADAKLLSGLLQSGELSRRYLLVVEQGQQSSPIAISAFTALWVKQLQRLEGVEQAWLANSPPREWVEAFQTYAPYHGRIYSLNPQSDGPNLFDPSQLPGRAEGLKRALLSPQGGFVKAIAKQDPLLLLLNGFKDLQNQFQRQAQRDQSGGALILQSQAPPLDSELQAALQRAIRDNFAAFNQRMGSHFRLAMAGVPVFSVAAHHEISQDVTVVSVVSSVAVSLAFLLLFRSFAALHWVMAIQAASFVVGTLATALVFPQVHSLTLAMGASLIGICTDYPVHVMVHSAKHRNTTLAAARLLWPSLALGGLTTVIGYAALGWTGFPGFEQIAVFAFASIMASLGLTRWVLPALIDQSKLHAAHLPGINAWVAFCDRHRRALWIVFGIAFLLAALALPKIRWMDDMQKLALDMELLKRQDQAVRDHFSNIEPGRFVLVEAADFETALRRSEAAERRLQQLEQQGLLAEYHGLFPWLVSEQLQTENAQVFQRALTPNFQAAWLSALKQAGLSVEKLGQLVVPEIEPLNPGKVLSSPIKQIVSGQILQSPQAVTLILWLGEHDPAKLEAGLQGLEGTRYFSQKDQLDRLASQYRDRSLFMLGFGILAMSLLIWVQQKSLLKVVLTLLPSLASVLFIFASWALVGEEVSFLHVIGLLLALSLCVDYGIFFMDNRSQDSDITYHAIASSTLTTLASFGALALAKTPTLPIMAFSVSLGVTLGFLLCPILIQKQDNQSI